MAICAYCGADFPAKRSDAKYCCAKHRVYARRQRLRVERESERRLMTLEGRTMLDKLAVVLPVTAARVESFVQVNGTDCAEAAVKLVLSAYSEALGGYAK